MHGKPRRQTSKSTFSPHNSDTARCSTTSVTTEPVFSSVELIDNSNGKMVAETENMSHPGRHKSPYELSCDSVPEPVEHYIKMLAILIDLAYCCVGAPAKFLMGNYKPLGLSYGADTPKVSDHSLTVIGTICGVLSALGRPFWGILGDKIGFYAVLANSILIFLFSTLYVTAAETSIIFLGFITGGIYFSTCTDSLWLPICIDLAGKVNGPRIYGYIVIPARMSSAVRFDLLC